MIPSAWNQTLTVTWRPRLAFFENRLALLKSFEEEGAVYAFRFEPGVIGVRLHDNNLELTLTSTSLTMRASTLRADMARLQEAGRRAFTAVAPDSVTATRLDLQHVGPLHQDYDAARRDSARAWFGSWVDRTKVVDHALLVDGESRSSRATYTMEFGVVSASELPSRLDRAVGRVSTSGQVGDPSAYHPPSRAAVNWGALDLPAVAVFVDSTWRSIEAPPKGDIYQQVWGYWKEMEAEATQVVTDLVDLVDGSTEG